MNYPIQPRRDGRDSRNGRNGRNDRGSGLLIGLIILAAGALIALLKAGGGC